MRMSPPFLSQADIRAMCISPAEARNAVLDAIRDFGSGNGVCPPKTTMAIDTGHSFQSMAATLPSEGIAALKWLGVTPVNRNSASAGINSLIIVSDYGSGRPLAVMDSNEITLLRTAALSAAAAQHLAPSQPGTIGMIGCGLQAHAHLNAFMDVFPNLHTLLAFSRSMSSAEGLAAAGRQRGLVASTVETPAEVVEKSEIVISMVPAAPGLVPFLDARRMKNDSFASAVDLGRNWLPESFLAFRTLATDTLTQSRAPYNVQGEEVGSAAFTTDLVALVRQSARGASGRNLFCFNGIAVADAALAAVAMRKAVQLFHS